VRHRKYAIARLLSLPFLKVAASPATNHVASIMVNEIFKVEYLLDSKRRVRSLARTKLGSKMESSSARLNLGNYQRMDFYLPPIANSRQKIIMRDRGSSSNIIGCYRSVILLEGSLELCDDRRRDRAQEMKIASRRRRRRLSPQEYARKGEPARVEQQRRFLRLARV